MQKYFVLIFYCTFHEILLLLIVEGGAINFDALHQLLYLWLMSQFKEFGLLSARGKIIVKQVYYIMITTKQKHSQSVCIFQGI